MRFIFFILFFGLAHIACAEITIKVKLMTNLTCESDTYARKLSGEDKKQFDADPIKYFEKCAQWSAAANLKLALYYSGANLKIFDKIGGDANLPYDQEFSGFSLCEDLYAQNTPHTNLAKALSFCDAAIRIEEAKEDNEWSIIRDFNIVKATILLADNAPEAAVQKTLFKIFKTHGNTIDVNHSNVMGYALYAYLMLEGRYVKMNKAEFDKIISDRSILAYWSNFYFGYMLPKDKAFAIEILKRHSSKLYALKTLCKIYSGAFDPSDENPAEFERYNALLKEKKQKR